MALTAGAGAQAPTEIVEVVGQTPLGTAIDVDRIAANVQQVGAESIAAQRLLDLSEYMRRNLGGVFVNEAQSNPLQPDVQYRGFVGSPLLGLPQGLAVYQDGVRLNEPFGDTINWALIPDSAIESLVLMPGSNPLFGLNAIGGSIAVRTKDGFSDPGTSLELNGGSFGRVGLQAETGGGADEFAHFVAVEYLEEDAWRDYSPTESTQLFSKLSWRSERTDIDLGFSFAATDLIGNGAAPVELLALDRKAVFTRPDQTENDLTLLNLVLDHELSTSLSLTGNIYLRDSDIDSLNGDDSDFAECEDAAGFVCREEDGQEELAFDVNDKPIPYSEQLEGATVNRTRTLQDGSGLGLQANWTADWRGRENSLVVGVAYDDAAIDFWSSTELGALDPTRLAVPGGVFVGDLFTEIAVETTNLGLFVSDTFALNDKLSVVLSGRFNDTDVLLRDQLGTALDGDHEFRRFNPAVGLTAKLSQQLTFYAGYSESSRAPSPVELTCADADDPCRLPNAFLADPPLEQVVAKTLEAGLRGRGEAIEWHAGLFRTTSHDDIIFISAGALSNEGYFDNVGRTRRDGVELNVSGAAGRASWFVNYSFLAASFRENLMLPSPNNPAAVDGEVSVRAGAALPLLPRHLIQAGIELTVTDSLRFGASFGANTSFHRRGDEGNDIDKIGQHAVVGLRGDYEINERLTIFAAVDNVFDAEYETFGVFGAADEVLGDAFSDSRFVSPSAPRGVWVGLRFDL